MLKKILLLVFIIVAFLTQSPAQTQFKMYIPSYEVTQGSATIEVMVENAPQIGALQFNLFYDPKILEITNVSAGKLTSKAMIVDNVDNRNGKATIGIISLTGFSKKGSIINLYVNIRGSQGDVSELKLSIEKNGMITDTKNKEVNMPVLENGAVKVGGSVLSWTSLRWILFGLLLATIIILLVLWIQKRKKS